MMGKRRTIEKWALALYALGMLVLLFHRAPAHSGEPYAQELLRQISRFPETVREAANRYEPSIITRAVTELCKAYNKFYYENRIIVDEAPVREARVRLTRAVKNTIKTGLYLIGMEAPERM